MTLHPTFRFRTLAHSLALALGASSSLVFALPQGATVAGGNASVSSAGKSTTVTQTSASAILDWRSFSLGAGEHVNFIQPSSSASILNRVVGAEPSSILGQLSANGRVFLVNPNGIIFGQGSRVDAAGLVASTANISNANFMAGKYQFDQVSNRQATIVNRGEITVQQGGLVALVAPGVENSGIIRADLGRVALASGNAFTLDLYGDKLLSFAVSDAVSEKLTDMQGVPLAAYVSNTGSITAEGGSVLIAAHVARSVVDSAINLSGLVRAQSVAQHGGEIILSGGEGAVRIGGTLDATAQDAGLSGGHIAVTGRDIQIASGALLDASGHGGGSIQVGGDFQGGGTLAHADVTRVAAGATLRADGGNAGNGGQVVLWSDQQTDFAGSISARGGVNDGNGGAVETSSKGVLNYSGAVDLAAPHGTGGSLLLDPVELTIDSVLAGSLSTTLRSGAAATKVTTTGDLVLASVIDGRGGTAGGSLTLSSGAGMAINADIYTNNGAVTLSAANGGITMASTGGTATTQTLIYSGNGAITLNATGGNISAQHLLTSGAVSLTTATSGNVTLNQSLGGTAGLGSLSVQSAGGAALASVKTTGAISATTGASSSVFVNGILDAGTTLALGTAGGAIKLRHNVKAGGNITFNADVLVNPQDEILVKVANNFNAADYQTFASAAAYEAYMTANNVVPLGGNAPSSWDPVAMRATVQSTGGSITFNKGLLWDGSGVITDASTFNLFRYYTGQDPTNVSRASLTPVGTRYFVVQLNGSSVNFAGTGYLGWNAGAVPTVSNADNPSGIAGGQWCMNDINGTPLGMVLSASTAMSVSGNYANSGISHADTHTVDSTGFGGGVLFLTNNTGVGSGSFTVPSAAASTAVLLSLSDIALPGVQPIAIGTGGGGTGTGTGTGTGIGTGTVTTDATTNSLGNATNNTNMVVSNDPGPNNAQDETRSPSDVADLGRGSAANGRDPFTGDFRLVSSSGDLGGQPYFTANLFDFAANKSSQPNRDEERR